MEFSTRTVIVFIALAVLPVDSHGGEIVFPAELAGRKVRYSISTAQIESTPKWLDGDDSPPFAARKAMALAALSLPSVTSKVVGERVDRREWKLGKVCLEEFAGRWFWMVTFENVTKDGAIGTGIQAQSHIVILMDGTVVIPKLAKNRVE